MRGWAKARVISPRQRGGQGDFSLGAPPEQTQRSKPAPGFKLQARARPESVTQTESVAWFERHALPYGSTIRAVPNGMWFGVGGKREAGPTLAQRIRAKQVIDQQVAMGMKPGTPDTHTGWPAHSDPRGSLPDCPAGAGWMEYKREDGTYSDLSLEQRKELLDLHRSGQRVAIVRTAAEAETVYLIWGVHLRRRWPLPLAPLSPRRQPWPLEGEDLCDMILRTTEPRWLRLWGHAPRAPLGGTGTATNAGERIHRLPAPVETVARWRAEAQDRKEETRAVPAAQKGGVNRPESGSPRTKTKHTNTRSEARDVPRTRR